MKIKIGDRCHRESTLVVTITTPKDGMKYDERTVQRGAKRLVAALSARTSSGFTLALEKELRERHNSQYGDAVE